MKKYINMKYEIGFYKINTQTEMMYYMWSSDEVL